MDIAMIGRSMVVFLMFVATLALNVDDNLVARLGLEGNFALMLGLAVLFTLFMAGRSMVMVGAAVCLCLIANMPADFGLNFGLDRDYFAGVMIALLAQPVVARVMA